ncbi:MAG: class I tRNA ligase family protein [Candidatus Bathyarchaeia archaeon]
MLNIYNTLTRKIEPFQSNEPGKVKMFTCGPSTYQRAHIGNYRTFLFEDILQRYLEYQGYKVTRAMALTDVEDKAIIQAKKEGLTVEALTQKNEAVFFDDFEWLHIKKPDYPVRASRAVDQATGLIARLLDCGYAYWYTYRGVKNAYFDPWKFRGFGKLVHLDMSKWPKRHRRYHKDTYPGTPWNMGDFILWHGCGLEDVCYDTAIGSGRPAWNIQDAAIATKTLGYSIDVACGGIDNLVRHHDYTLAIAESVSGEQFSRCWLHGGHLFVDGEKMSKSKGNVYYTSDVTSKGFSGTQLRFFLIYGPYRETLNFTLKKLREASEQLDSLRHMIADLQGISGPEKCQGDSYVGRLKGEFEAHMNNDLDVKGAFDSLSKTVAEIHKNRATLSDVELKNVLADLAQIDSVLQCLF